MAEHTKGWRADCFRTRMAEFDAAYAKACGSSQPDDWMQAALLAQQFRNVAYAVLTGEAPQQKPPEEYGFVLVPREPTDKMVEAGGQALPPTHRLTDCYDYFREAWEAALSERPLPPNDEAKSPSLSIPDDRDLCACKIGQCHFLTERCRETGQ